MAKLKKIYEIDPWLEPFKGAIDARTERLNAAAAKLAGNVGGKDISSAANNHLWYGLHKTDDGGWVLREWAPNATRMYLVGEFNNWKRTPDYQLKPVGGGNWEIKLPGMFLRHGALYKLWTE